MVMDLLDDKRLPDNLHRDLIKRLLKTVPILVEKIAPNGFENSTYFHLYRSSIKVEYYMYRDRRVEDYLRFRYFNKDAPYDFKEKLTFEEFSDQFVPTPAILPDEPFMILMQELQSLMCRGCYFYNSNDEFYSFDDYDGFCKIVNYKTFSMKLRAGLQFYQRTYTAISYDEELISLSEVHRHIFDFFKNEGLYWHFRNSYFDFLLTLQAELSDKAFRETLGEEELHMGDAEIIANLLKLDKPSEDNNFEQAYPEFGPSFARYFNEEPKDTIKIYKEVYGDWPRGYPPKITDYI